MTRRDLTLIAACSFSAGLLTYLVIDRITFLTGHTVRDLRYAGRTA